MRLNLSLGLLASLQLITGFVFQLVVLTLVGAGPATDAWLAAQAVPIMFFGILASIIQGVWQSRLAATGMIRSEWFAQIQIAYGQFCLLCFPIFFLLVSTSNWWIERIFIGFDSNQIDMATRLSTPLLAAMVMNIQSALAMTALRGRDRFIACEVIALVVGMISIFAIIWLIPIFGIDGAAWVSLCRSTIVAISLFCLSGYPWPRVMLAIQDKISWSSVRPLLTGGFVYKSGPLVDRVFSSMTPPGGMTVFSLAHMGVSAIGVVLERAMTTPLSPVIARLIKDRKWELVASTVRTNLLRGLIVPLIAFLFIIISSNWWEDLLEIMVKFDENQARENWKICLVFTLLLYPLSVGATVVSTLYALGDTKIVVYVGVVGFFFSLLIKYIFFNMGGLVGLAIGICIYYLINFLVMTLFLHWHLRRMK